MNYWHDSLQHTYTLCIRMYVLVSCIWLRGGGVSGDHVAQVLRQVHCLGLIH